MRHFGHFLLRHFDHWNISVICLTVAVTLAVAVFFSLYFQTFWPKWLNCFWSFQKHFGLWPKKNSFQQWRPRQLACDCVAEWYRLWRGVVTGWQDTPLSEANTQGEWLWLTPPTQTHLSERDTVTLGPAASRREHCLPPTRTNAFHEKTGHMLSRDQQNMRRRHWHSPNLSLILLEIKIWS